MSEPLTDEEIHNTKSILEKFYGSQARNWRVSTRTMRCLASLFQKQERATN